METQTDNRPFVPTEHDEVVELADGRALRLLVEPDFDTSIGDFDCYGAVAWVETNRDTGHTIRPDGFNGRARKLWTRSDVFWWQPPADVADDDLRTMGQHVADLMEYGFSVFVLELLGPEDDADFYGRRPVLDVNAIGGVECFADSAYVQDLAEDMAGELLGDDAGELVRNA